MSESSEDAVVVAAGFSLVGEAAALDVTAAAWTAAEEVTAGAAEVAAAGVGVAAAALAARMEDHSAGEMFDRSYETSFQLTSARSLLLSLPDSQYSCSKPEDEAQYSHMAARMEASVAGAVRSSLASGEGAQHECRGVTHVGM